MKKTTRTFLMALAVVMVFAFGTTAFAAGSNLYHSGTSKISYVTDDYVSQQNDLYLSCTSTSGTNGTFHVAPVIWSGGNVQKLIGDITFQVRNNAFKFQPQSSVRRVYLQLSNSGGSYNVSKKSVGNWVLTRNPR